MHYNVTNQEHFTDTMNPHTSKRDYFVARDNSHLLMDFILEHDPFYKIQFDNEAKPLFKPMKDLIC